MRNSSHFVINLTVSDEYTVMLAKSGARKFNNLLESTMAVINGDNQANNLLGTAAADTIDAKTRPTASGSGTDVVNGLGGIDTLVVDASAETQAVQLYSSSGTNFQVRSTSGNFYVDAYNMELIDFTGGSGDDYIDTAEHGGSIDGGAGIDYWISDLSGLFTGITFNLGTTTSIAAAGLTSITRIERINIKTGSGNDVVSGGAQGDSISTGDGNDVINMRTRQTSVGAPGDYADGGEGIDKLQVLATGDTLGIQLSNSGTTFQVRSTSGSYYVDAYNMELIEFAGGSGNDVISTGERGGSIDGNGGIDLWTANFSAATGNIAFTLGTTTAIASVGITSILDIERINLTTGSGNDTIRGGNQADSIVTGAGNDVIDLKTRPTSGGSGTDFADGRQGTDRLVVNASAETLGVQFSVNGGTFQVRSTSTNFYVDAYNMEVMEFTGGAGDDTFSTGDRGGTINGGAGIDYWTADLSGVTSGITFLLGTTTSIGAVGLNSILGIERINLRTGSGSDSLQGGVQGDTIYSGNGDDWINLRTRPTASGSATDYADAGAGVDTLFVNAASETLGVQFSTNGLNAFYVRSDSGNYYQDVANAEIIKFYGGSGNDSINTASFAGVVDGNGGTDRWTGDLSGVGGAITFVVGTTTSIAAAGLTIEDIEAITLITGSGNDTISGGAEADSITTGNGNDTINAKTRPTFSGAQADLVDGQGGTDILVVTAGGETAGVQIGYNGTSYFSVRSTSGNHYVDAYNMEILQANTGSGADNITGANLGDTITSNAGNDTVDGGSGNDIISTGADDDRIRGGRGQDQLTGGSGSDVFDWDLVIESGVASGTVDTITDFVSGVDDLDLSGIDANNIASDGNQAFTFLGSSAFTGLSGQLRAVAGIVEADVNGDGVADFRVLLSNNAIAVAADFVL